MSEADKESEGKRPRSFIEDEDIIIKPSTELIPDEYERDTNENMLVELICRRDDESADSLADNLSNLAYLVNRTNVKASIDDIWISNFIANVKRKIEEKSYDGLLFVFAKFELKSEQMQRIWASFTASNCTALKDKPKILIFQDLKRGTATDSANFLQTDLKTAYDTPSEADILIVYDKYSSADSSNDFLDYLNDNIKEFGIKEDLINIVSLCIGSESRPLVISTMTRKFFFTVNQYRGHHHNILENHAEIKKTLEQIKQQIHNSSKPKEKASIMSRIRGLKESFRSKNHRGELQNGENRIKENITNRKYDEDSANKDATKYPKNKPENIKPPAVDMVSPAAKSPTRKTSTSSITVTPARNSTRTRLPSGTFSSKEDVAKKPPWK